MNESNPLENNAGDELLERSIGAIKNEPEPQGPSAQTITNTLAAIRRAERSRKPASIGLMQRVITMTFVQKLAATVMLTTGGLFLWFAFTRMVGLPRISYGDVAEHIRDAHTLVWTETVSQNGSNPPISLRMLFLAPGHMRTETAGQVSTIIDVSAGKELVLEPAQKTAMLLDIKGLSSTPAEEDMTEQFRDLGNGQGEPIEDRTIGGVTAKGFRVSFGARTVDVWADPATKEPILVEMPLELGGKTVQVELRDIEFDLPLSEDLFSTAPPSGYTLRTSGFHIHTDMETNIVELLSLYAKHFGGKFPETLDFSDMAATEKNMMKVFSAPTSSGGLDPDFEQMMADFGGMFGGLYTSKKGTDYEYTGAGVKLGDRNRIVFWYSKPGTQNYRAVYGDLHVAKITQNELPK